MSNNRVHYGSNYVRNVSTCIVYCRLISEMEHRIRVPAPPLETFPESFGQALRWTHGTWVLTERDWTTSSWCQVASSVTGAGTVTADANAVPPAAAFRASYLINVLLFILVPGP